MKFFKVNDVREGTMGSDRMEISIPNMSIYHESAIVVSYRGSTNIENYKCPIKTIRRYDSFQD